MNAAGWFGDSFVSAHDIIHKSLLGLADTCFAWLSKLNRETVFKLLVDKVNYDFVDTHDCKNEQRSKRSHDYVIVQFLCFS